MRADPVWITAALLSNWRFADRPCSPCGAWACVCAKTTSWIQMVTSTGNRCHKCEKIKSNIFHVSQWHGDDNAQRCSTCYYCKHLQRIHPGIALPGGGIETGPGPSCEYTFCQRHWLWVFEYRWWNIFEHIPGWTCPRTVAGGISFVRHWNSQIFQSGASLILLITPGFLIRLSGKIQGRYPLILAAAMLKYSLYCCIIISIGSIGRNKFILKDVN